MTQARHRIMAVIDPTRGDQLALRKAIMVAHGRDDIEVYAYLCVYSGAKSADAKEHRKVELRRQRLWLDDLFAGLGDIGVSIKSVVEWHKDWRVAMASAVDRLGTELVIKRASGRPRSVGSSDRQLIRTVNAGMLLVKNESLPRRRTVLAALNFNSTDHAHEILNDAIIEIANRILGTQEGSELHVVNAYPDSGQFVHPPDIAKRVGVERSHAHAREGKPAAIIEETAYEIGADLVIIGNVGRRGLAGISIGNTAEKILSGVDADVLIISRDSEQERDAA